MISLPQYQKPPPAAGCGPCTLCCDVAGVSELGKPAYARCAHLTTNCEIYEDRPETCRLYRCAWHLGVMGDRVDRRPDHTGVVFQFEDDQGRWYLVLYEAVPGAAFSEKARYLAESILKHKRVQNLAFGTPAIRIVPYGSDIPLSYPISDVYEGFTPPEGPAETRVEGNVLVFAGKTRQMLMPKMVKVSTEAGSTAPKDAICE